MSLGCVTKFLPAMLLFLAGTCFAQFGFEPRAQPEVDYSPISNNLSVDAHYTSVDGQGMGGLSGHANYGLGPRTLAFAEVSVAKGDANFAMLSAGLGLRRLLSNGQTVIGVNTFYDALEDETGFSYSQLGLGLEVSHGRWVMNANGYLPVGDRAEHSSHTRTVTQDEGHQGAGESAGNEQSRYLETVDMETIAMRGWDVETGMELFKYPKFLQALLSVGYYCFWDGGYDVDGVKIRSDVQLGRHVRVGAEWRQNGGDIGQEWRVGVRFTYLLGGVPSPAATAPLPMLAIAPAPLDGKSVVPVLSGKSAKSVQPVQADGKSVAPLFEAAPPVVFPPNRFFSPVYRSPWPTVLTRRTVHLKMINEAPPPISTIAPPCDCLSGPALFYP